MSLKYVKKRNSYERQNLKFDLNTEIGKSYDWYQIAKKIGGVMYVNTFSYSRTTTRHYSEILHLLRQLGYENIHTIEAPQGLNNVNITKAHYIFKIKELEEKITNPRCKKALIKERQTIINCYNRVLDTYLLHVASEEFDSMINDTLSAV
jgi:hypothetical protein